MKTTLLLSASVLVTPLLTGFVLLGKERATLPATEENPTITFNWATDQNAPSLTNKEKYKDGTYANFSDEALTPILIQEAIDQWNAIRGSYLRFQLNSTTGELAVDPLDQTYNIVVKKTNSASEAAHASPHLADGTSTIDDCDITINDNKTSVLGFMTTITHELGHCVGLGHPHANYGSIMSYSRGGSSYRLSPDDKAGAIYLYPDSNYVDGEPKELIGCGTIRGSHAGESSGWTLYLMLLLPIALGAVKPRNRQHQERSVTSA